MAVGLQEVLDVRVQHWVALRVQAFSCDDFKLEPSNRRLLLLVVGAEDLVDVIQDHDHQVVGFVESQSVKVDPSEP